jgi:tetratricopeptide (TPR) repeat protein
VFANAREIHQGILAGQDALYHGRFDEALERFRSLTRTYPDDPKGFFFFALTYRWLTRLDPGSEVYQKQFEQAVKKSISVAKSLARKDEDNVEALLYLAASYGYRAEYYNFLKHRWSNAYDDAVKMQTYLKDAEKFSNRTIDVQLGYGLYDYYAFRYRKKIGWWRFLLSLPKGDKEKGLQILEDVRQHGIYSKVEAWYFLIEIYRDEREYKQRAIALCEELHRTYPDNPFFHALLAGVYHRNHHWEASIRTSREILAQVSKHDPYYTDYIRYQAKYLIGEGSFFMAKYEEALREFNDIIASQPEHPPYLLPWSHLRRGTIYSIIGQHEKATAEYQLVLEMKDVLNVHDWAEKLLQKQREKD